MVGLPGLACTFVRPREVGGELQLGKVITAGKTKFSRGKEGKRVERRGEALTKEYEQVLRDFDVRFRLRNEK